MRVDSEQVETSLSSTLNNMRLRLIAILLLFLVVEAQNPFARCRDKQMNKCPSLPKECKGKPVPFQAILRRCGKQRNNPRTTKCSKRAFNLCKSQSGPAGAPICKLVASDIRKRKRQGKNFNVQVCNVLLAKCPRRILGRSFNCEPRRNPRPPTPQPTPVPTPVPTPPSTP